MELVERLRERALYLSLSHTRRDAALITEAANLLEEALKALDECASDLEAEVRQRWGDDKRLARNLARDLAPVVAARAILARAQGEKIDG